MNKIKKLLLLTLTALAFVFGAIAFASCDTLSPTPEPPYSTPSTEGLVYTLNEDGNSYCCTGIGNCTETEIVIASNYEGKPVTAIGDMAFIGIDTKTGEPNFCATLTSITIPNSINSIGEDAFYNCSSLTSIEIPNSVTSIGSMAFYGCSSLTSIEIPDSVTSIGEYAFNGCSGLTIYCEVASKPSGWTDYWDNYSRPVVWDCKNNDVANDGYIYTVVDGLRYGIKDGVATVVEQPANITTANIPNSITYKNRSYNVTSIGDDAFSCRSSFRSNLQSVTIGNSVTSIGSGAFYRCNSLTNIEIPNSVTSIGDNAFESCSSLTNIEIPNSVTSIGVDAFTWCSSLQYNVKDNLKYLGNKTNSYLYLVGPTSSDNIIANIDKSCKFIGSYAFWFRSGLTTSITFNGTIEEWTAIKKGSYWNVNAGDFTVTCTNGTLDSNGNVITA